MKKLLALVMSLCLLCACCAYAEETVEINWSDVEEQASAIEGQFAPMDDEGFAAVAQIMAASLQNVQ